MPDTAVASYGAGQLQLAVEARYTLMLDADAEHVEQDMKVANVSIFTAYMYCWIHDESCSAIRNCIKHP
eukprot:14486359-Ditylum_brightwellii.AAC.1